MTSGPAVAPMASLFAMSPAAIAIDSPTPPGFVVSPATSDSAAAAAPAPGAAGVVENAAMSPEHRLYHRVSSSDAYVDPVGLRTPPRSVDGGSGSGRAQPPAWNETARTRPPYDAAIAAVGAASTAAATTAAVGGCGRHDGAPMVASPAAATAPAAQHLLQLRQQQQQQAQDVATAAPGSLDMSYVSKRLVRPDERRHRRASCRTPSAAAAKESRVLVLYSGGTIGMIKNRYGVLAPEPQMMEKKLRTYPQLHDVEYAARAFAGSASEQTPLVLPDTGDPLRVVYTIYEYQPLLDSSNMTMDDWIRISLDIQHFYMEFDGFVILHGTDTMSYTASALSFMLENLGKSVIITGSQIPLFEPRSDGRENLLNALIIAGNYIIPEVTLLFNNKLFRGNRTIKHSATNMDAFSSPNLPPLAAIGIKINVDWKAVVVPSSIDKFRVHSMLSRNVGLLRLFPSITVEVVRAFLTPPLEGVILQTYGAGNGPTSRKDLLDEIRRATSRGVIIVNCSQCPNGRVEGVYETGNALVEAGVILGSDMTPEAALTKLSYILSKKEWSLATKKQMMQTNLRGELTIVKDDRVEDLDLITAIAKAMNISSSDELEALKTSLLPSILCNVAAKGDCERLEVMRQFGAYLSACDYDFRTPLHIAAAEGNAPVVEYLLKQGASVYMRDRDQRTPLLVAIDWDHHEVIDLLVRSGSHLSLPPEQLAEAINTAARKGDLRRLESYRRAGANLADRDVAGRTAAHAAAECSQLGSVAYLLEYGFYTPERDLYGHTARDIAALLGFDDIVCLIDENYRGDRDDGDGDDEESDGGSHRALPVSTDPNKNNANEPCRRHVVPDGIDETSDRKSVDAIGGSDRSGCDVSGDAIRCHENVDAVNKENENHEFAKAMAALSAIHDSEASVRAATADMTKVVSSVALSSCHGNSSMEVGPGGPRFPSAPSSPSLSTPSLLSRASTMSMPNVDDAAAARRAALISRRRAMTATTALAYPCPSLCGKCLTCNCQLSPMLGGLSASHASSHGSLPALDASSLRSSDPAIADSARISSSASPPPSAPASRRSPTPREILLSKDAATMAAIARINFPQQPANFTAPTGASSSAEFAGSNQQRSGRSVSKKENPSTGQAATSASHTFCDSTPSTVINFGVCAASNESRYAPGGAAKPLTSSLSTSSPRHVTLAEPPTIGGHRRVDTKTAAGNFFVPPNIFVA